MNEHFKYDPEDIESLMLHKPYDKLLADEKTFVLKHLSSKEEYEFLRSTLLQTMDDFSSEDFTPPPGLKQNLVQEFKKKHRQPGFTVWLNGLFASAAPRPFYLQPYFQLAMVSIVVVVGAYFLFDRPANDISLAVEKSGTTEKVQNEPYATEQFLADEDKATISEQEFITDISANLPAENQVQTIEENSKQAELIENKEVIVQEEVSRNYATTAATEDMEMPAASKSAANVAPATKSLLIDSGVYDDLPTSPVNDDLLNLLFSAR